MSTGKNHNKNGIQSKLNQQQKKTTTTTPTSTTTMDREYFSSGRQDRQIHIYTHSLTHPHTNS